MWSVEHRPNDTLEYGWPFCHHMTARFGPTTPSGTQGESGDCRKQDGQSAVLHVSVPVAVSSCGARVVPRGQPRQNMHAEINVTTNGDNTGRKYEAAVDFGSHQ